MISEAELSDLAVAYECNTYVDFFKADITDFRATEYYDIIFSSGVYHFIKPEIRLQLKMFSSVLCSFQSW